MKKKIGVLALQGSFAEHISILSQLDSIETYEIRTPSEIENMDGIILPGGESTTIRKLMKKYNLIKPLQKKAQAGIPVWGTCAGMILMAKKVIANPSVLNLMDIEVKRNAFGRQIDSFQTNLNVKGIANPVPVYFIRAPIITSIDPAKVTVLATLEDQTIVAVKQQNLLATSFHPELSDDSSFHRYFVSLC